jgi:hypothetical protein
LHVQSGFVAQLEEPGPEEEEPGSEEEEEEKELKELMSEVRRKRW